MRLKGQGQEGRIQFCEDERGGSDSKFVVLLREAKNVLHGIESSGLVLKPERRADRAAGKGHA